MTDAKDIMHKLQEHIAGIRGDAAWIRTQVGASKRLEVKHAKEIVARLDQIDMRLDEMGALSLPDVSAVGPTPEASPAAKVTTRRGGVRDMTGADITTRLEQALDAAWMALRHLSGDDDDAIADACDAVDAVVHRDRQGRSARNARRSASACKIAEGLARRLLWRCAEQLGAVVDGAGNAAAKVVGRAASGQAEL